MSGNGKFAVITHPDHVKFVNTKQHLDSLEIPLLITNIFGLPTSYVSDIIWCYTVAEI